MYPASSQSFSSIKWIVHLDINSKKIVTLLERQKGESSSAIPPVGTCELCLHCLTATPEPAHRTWLRVLAAWDPSGQLLFYQWHSASPWANHSAAPCFTASICKSRGEALPLLSAVELFQLVTVPLRWTNNVTGLKNVTVVIPLNWKWI